MKTLSSAVLACALFVGVGLYTVNASAAGPYRCRLSGQIQGASIAIGFGGEVLSGNGELKCRNMNTGNVTEEPVSLQLLGGGAGFDFTIVRDVHIHTADVSVDNPARLFGSFGVGATTGATLVAAGIEADTALMLNEPGGLNFEVGLQGRDAIGLGVHLYGDTFAIQRQ